MLRDPDSNPYSLLEGEGELADADLSEGMGGDRRRRSRRRRNDQEPSIMDAAAESDSQAGPSENGLGETLILQYFGRFKTSQCIIADIFLIWLSDEEARPQRRNRSLRRRNRGNRPEGGSTSRDRQPGENGELTFSLQ